MGRELGSLCYWLLTCKEGRVARPPATPYSFVLRTGADPRSSAVHGRRSVLWTLGMWVALPFWQGAPSWACTRTLLNERGPRRQGVRPWRIEAGHAFSY